MIEDLEAKRPFIEKFSFTDPERYWHYLHHLMSLNPFLVCALDIAGWDLFARMRRKKLYELWGLDITKAPATDYTIGIDTIEEMARKIKDNPWPVYKIKLGTDNDVEIVTELRKHTDAVFRVDANGAWQAEKALQKINAFKDLNVELVEQPLAKDDWEGMKYLHQHSLLPLFADESCVNEKDIEKCFDHFHGINIKLTKCSGITPARRMITKARELSMKVMLGSMNETSVGSAAMAHLAPLADLLDMDGTLLLEENVGEGMIITKEGVRFGDEPGLGVSVSF